MVNDSKNQPQPISIWLESLCSSTNAAARTEAESLARDGKDEAILALLAKLSLHYWRPDFTPSQAKQLYSDYLDDLRDYPLSEISSAIAKYRQSEERFYPSSGALVQIIRTIPAWDVRSAKEHAGILRHVASEELQRMTKRIEAQLGPAKPIPALGAPTSHASEVT